MVAPAALAMLTRMGHGAHHVADGAEAWTHLTSDTRHYDVLLLDVNMPRVSGVELVLYVRASPCASRIAMMSGRVDEEELRALEAMHVDSFLAKPFTREELVAALNGTGQSSRVLFPV